MMLLCLLPSDVVHYVAYEYLDVIELTKLSVCGIKDILKCDMLNDDSVEIMLNGSEIIPIPLNVIGTLNKQHFYVNKLKLKESFVNDIVLAEDCLPLLIKQASKLSFLCICCNGSVGEKFILQHATNILELKCCNEWIRDLDCLTPSAFNQPEQYPLVGKKGLILDVSQCYDLESMSERLLITMYIHVTELNLSYCYLMTNSSLEMVKIYARRLKIIDISNCIRINRHQHIPTDCTVVGLNTLKRWIDTDGSLNYEGLWQFKLEPKLLQREQEVAIARKCNKISGIHDTNSIIKMKGNVDWLALINKLSVQLLHVAHVFMRTCDRVGEGINNPLILGVLTVVLFARLFAFSYSFKANTLGCMMSPLCTIKMRCPSAFRRYFPLWLMQVCEFMYKALQFLILLFMIYRVVY